MEVLVGSDYVAIDCEWRPFIHRQLETERIALLQIGNKRNVFLIDMIKLKQND